MAQDELKYNSTPTATTLQEIGRTCPKAWQAWADDRAERGVTESVGNSVISDSVRDAFEQREAGTMSSSAFLRIMRRKEKQFLLWRDSEALDTISAFYPEGVTLDSIMDASRSEVQA